jgi:large subunit ribosomal protein L9
MDVILLDKVSHLGHLGDQVTVKAGYARNFLIPKGKAVIPTAENIAFFKTRQTELQQAAETRLQQAKTRQGQLSALMRVQISARSGAEGKLFGSIGARDIALATAAAGVELSKQELSLPNGPLRQVGEHVITYQLHAEVSGTLSVEVVAAV